MTAAAGAPPQSVWVLDDEAGIRAFLSHALARLGYAPELFSDCPALFERLRSTAPDVLILDLALGHSDAVEVMQRLAAAEFAGRVLLISGLDQGTLREIQQVGRTRGLAMLPPLRKPFRVQELQTKLAAEPDRPMTATGPRRAAPTVRVDPAEALRQGWIELWYQPKVDLKSLSVSGAEALLRVRHPEHGIVLPGGFLSPPDDPLHDAIAAFIIRTATADWARFADVGLFLKLAINIPVSIIAAPGFVARLRESLPAGPDFPGLIVEVTEDEVVKDADLVKEVAAQLKLYKVRFSIDDLGTAHSSLARLLDIPFAEVKLDRSFVDGCGSEPLKHALCQTVIDLAHRCDARVCAEGLERLEDLRTLIGLGCDTVQGWLFARAMPAETLIENRGAVTLQFVEEQWPAAANRA